MSPGSDESTIPQWASDLRVSVAKIEGKTDQIPNIIQELKEVKATMVPMTEHMKILNDVEELKERDLGQRSDWEEMKIRVPVLWAAFQQAQGRQNFVLAWRAILTTIVAIIGLFITLHQAGFTMGFK